MCVVYFGVFELWDRSEVEVVMVNSSRCGRVGSMELFDRLLCVRKISKWFPGPMVAFFIASPFDQVSDFSVIEFRVHDLLDFVLLMVVHNFW